MRIAYLKEEEALLEHHALALDLVDALGLEAHQLDRLGADALELLVAQTQLLLEVLRRTDTNE